MTDYECETPYCSCIGFGVSPRPELDNQILCLSCLWERTGVVSIMSNGVGEADSPPEFSDWPRV